MDYGFDWEGFSALEHRFIYHAEGGAGGAREAVEKASELLVHADKLWIAHERLGEILHYSEQEERAALRNGRDTSQLRAYNHTLRAILALFDTSPHRAPHKPKVHTGMN